MAAQQAVITIGIGNAGIETAIESFKQYAFEHNINESGYLCQSPDDSNFN